MISFWFLLNDVVGYVVTVDGVQGTSALGTVSVTGGANVYPTGVYGTVAIGMIYPWTQVDTTQLPDWQQISTG
jgi:hypothetical protein